MVTGTSPLHSANTIFELQNAGNALGNEKKNPKPKNENSIQYVIWKLLQPDTSKRMKLEDALVIIEKQLSAAKKQKNFKLV